MSKGQPKVSIIMPIYNVSKFLRKSLGSAVNQTLKDIEIICVNDGSVDDSLSIIQEYAFHDPRIRIIDKKNGGYGHSVNCGLRIARGEYIGILEPDDFIEEQMFEKLYAAASENHADIVKSNYYEYSGVNDTNTYMEVLFALPYNQVVSAYDNLKIVHLRPCIWTAIYRRELLIDHFIWFNETPGASYQDTAFAFKAFVSAKSIYFLKEAYHHYRIDNDSSSVNSSGKIFSICDEFQSIQSFLNVDQENRNHYSGILQVLKYDSYMWNYGRIADEYKRIFRDQIALDFIKADYEKFLNEELFSAENWKGLQSIITEYKHRNKIRD